MASRKIQVEIIGDASSLEKAFGKAEKSGRSFGGTMGKIGKAAAFTAGGAALGGLFVTLKRGTDEFIESEQVAAQTAAALKSTGRAAGVTAKHIGDMATKLSLMSGVDDEVIQGMENMLLSFTGVRNEAGKGNKIFDRATKVILDYSARTGTDARGAARLFGKALNEISQGQIPKSIRGLGKLSDATVKEIKAHLKAGDAAGAQAVLLEQLEKRYGGAAKASGDTFSGSLNKLKNSFDELAGMIVGAAAPAVQKYVDKLSTWLSKSENQERVQKGVRDTIDAISGAVKTLKGAFDQIFPKVDAVVQLFGGWKRVLEAIILLKVASKIYGIADSFVRLGGDAGTAKGKVGGLAGSLKRLPKSVSIPLVVTAGVIFAYPWVKKFFEQFLGADFSGLSKEPANSIPNPRRRALHGKAGMSSAHTGTGPTVDGGPKRFMSGMAGMSSVGTVGAGAAAGAANVGGFVNQGTIHVHADDPQQFLNGLQKWAKRQRGSRAGRFGGHSLGLA